MSVFCVFVISGDRFVCVSVGMERGAQRVPPSSPSVRPIVIIISVPIVSASNDESSGEMTGSWELLVMILVGVCKTITELLVWLVG